MLHGKLKYNDEDLGSITFNVYAKDSFDTLKLYIMNDDYSNMTNFINANMVFDKVVTLKHPINSQGIIDESLPPERIIDNPYLDKNPSDNRRLDIKKANKYKTNITNRDFCTRIASLIRYCQMQGKKNYNQNIVNEEDHFQTERIVKIDDLGYMKYDMGIIRELNIVGKYVELVLHTVPDDIFDIGIFKELKEKDKYGNPLSVTPIENVGFKLLEEFLGFPYTPPIKNEPVNLFGMYETIEQVIEAHPDKNTDWILNRKYIIVTDEILEDVMNDFYNYDGWIAFDTETTGLKINFKSRTGEADQLVGVVLSKEKGTGYYFPLQHKLFDNVCNGDHWYFMEKYMKKLLETKKIIGHNIQFDWKVAYIYGINTNFLYDTMLAFGVTKRYEDSSFELGLKALVRNLFGLDMFDLGDFVTASSFSDSSITFADLTYELVRQYAPADGDMTLSLFEYLELHGILDKYSAHTVFDMEVNFSKAVAYSEFYGYHVNVNKIPEMREAILGGMDKHQKEMFRLAGKEFNPNSPKQLSTIMYDELGIEQIGEKRSTNKEILGTLADRTNEHGDPLYPFVVELKSYRDNEGIYKNFLKKLHIFATEDGFIFPEVMQLGTDTGRSSVKNPNYQSYNDPVKKNIIPREGYMHFDADFSQIEYRVLASMAGQESLMKEFDDPDLDYHTYQASRMFSIPYSLVSKSLRSQSKGINFGLPYGMGDNSLGARIFGERNKENERKAGALRRKFFQGQEKIEEFFEVTRSNGVANNFTSTFFGRRRYYNRGVFSVSEIRRQAGNHVIQGTAADIYKIACNRLFNRIVDEGWLGLALINVFVHDEVLCEVHQSINPYYWFKAWREEFQLVIDGFCKLFAGAGVGMSWYTAKKQDLPPQYIDEVINKYHEDMEWDENLPRFLKEIEDGYEDYKNRRIREYITDPVNEGEVIKPIIYSLLVEKVGDIIKEIQVSDLAVKLVKDYNSVLSGDLISTVASKDDKGYGKHKIKTLKDYLAVFIKYHGLEGQVYDIKSADDIQVNSSSSNDVVNTNVEFQDDDYTLEDIIQLRGYFRDEQQDIIYFTNKPMTYQGISTDLINYLYTKGHIKTEGTFKLALYNEQDRSVTVYNAFMNESDYQMMISLYNSLNRVNPSFVMGW